MVPTYLCVLTLRQSANLHFADVYCSLDIDLIRTSWRSDAGERHAGRVDACNLCLELDAESFVFVVGYSHWNVLSLSISQSDLYWSCTYTRHDTSLRTHWLNSTFCYCSDHDSGLDGKKGKARSVWMMLPSWGR